MTHRSSSSSGKAANVTDLEKKSGFQPFKHLLFTSFGVAETSQRHWKYIVNTNQRNLNPKGANTVILESVIH